MLWGGGKAALRRLLGQSLTTSLLKPSIPPQAPLEPQQNPVNYPGNLYPVDKPVRRGS